MVGELVACVVIFAALNGIVGYQLLTDTEKWSRKVTKWFFIVANAVALVASAALLIWL
ncbi:hypothetical protein [Cohnella fermenti]|uniref:hypothetical protein n=1 Tax=Cohnella fermenti TaxID=2565925 RepID=UPI001454D23E|nr:hypothetical protein [Cohnella fermenti]